MTEERTDNVQARLEALKPKQNVKSSTLNPWVLPGAGVIVGVGLGIAGMVAVMDQRNSVNQAETMPTSSVPDFQSGEGLGGFTTTRERPEPQAPAAEQAQFTPTPDPAVADMARQLEELQSQMDDQQGQVDDLNTQLQDAQTTISERDAALADAELERQRLEDELMNSMQYGSMDQAAAEAEAQRLAGLEERRAEEAAIRERQNTSSMIAYRAGSGGGGQAGSMESTGGMSVPSDGAASGGGAQDFLRAGATASTVTRAQVVANPAKTIVQGTMIEAALETSVDLSLPGNVVAIVSRDVWSMDMSQVLIPRGTKLYGRYSDSVEAGQRRVMVAWDRLVRADGQTVALEGYGTDRVGRSGLTGKVNNHTLARFGGAAVTSILGALPAALASAASDDDDDSDLADIYENAGQSATGALNDVTAGMLNRGPTITIHQGQVVIVRVNTDLEFF